MDNEQLIASLCDDIAMAYNGIPSIEDIQTVIADYENLYNTMLSSDIVSEVYWRFDVEETLYSVYEYDNTTDSYQFKDCYTSAQLEECGISEGIRIKKTIDSVQKYIIK